jgi:hypothetical protein
VGAPGFVYASATGISIAVPRFKSSGSWYESVAAESASEIFRFDIGASPEGTKFSSSGLVKGTVLNQFSMDEWDGNLRVATTSGRVPDPKTHSSVSILKPIGQTLTLQGMVDNIAPTEDIRSVRFDGDRGFLVTFKKTDPLFAVDLSNATAPLGFTSYAARQTLGLPMTICEGGGNGRYGQNMTFNGLLLLKASVEGGISNFGGVSHETKGTCNSWWTDSNSTVKRSIFFR